MYKKLSSLASPLTCKDSPLCADMKVELMYSVVELSVNKAVFDCGSLEKPRLCFVLFSG